MFHYSSSRILDNVSHKELLKARGVSHQRSVFFDQGQRFCGMIQEFISIGIYDIDKQGDDMNRRCEEEKVPFSASP